MWPQLLVRWFSFSISATNKKLCPLNLFWIVSSTDGFDSSRCKMCLVHVFYEIEALKSFGYFLLAGTVIFQKIKAGNHSLSTRYQLLTWKLGERTLKTGGTNLGKEWSGLKRPVLSLLILHYIVLSLDLLCYFDLFILQSYPS